MHISQIRSSRVTNVDDVLSKNQIVFVKVLSINKSDNKISLSMKEVDQSTGEDLKPNNSDSSSSDLYSNPDRPQSRFNNEPNKPNKKFNRMGSPERFELAQLKASGAISSSRDDLMDEDHDRLIQAIT